MAVGRREGGKLMVTDNGHGLSGIATLKPPLPPRVEGRCIPRKSTRTKQRVS